MKLLDRLPAGSWTPARPGAAERLVETERRLGRPLPTDLRELYRTCDSVELLDGTYTFLPFDQIGRLSAVQAGDDTEDLAPSTWIAIVDLQDGNYVGLNLAPNHDGTYDWLDCFHETIGEADVIASSLDDFLRQALERPDGHYWLKAGAAAANPAPRESAFLLPAHSRRLVRLARRRGRPGDVHHYRLLSEAREVQREVPPSSLRDDARRLVTVRRRLSYFEARKHSATWSSTRPHACMKA